MQEVEGYEQEKVRKSPELKIEMIRSTLLPVSEREQKLCLWELGPQVYLQGF